LAHWNNWRWPNRAFAWGDASSYWFIANYRFTSTIAWLRVMVRAGLANIGLAPFCTELAEAERRMRGRRALKFAESEGYVRSFLEEGPSLKPCSASCIKAKRRTCEEVVNALRRNNPLLITDLDRRD
jgi:hypothetical protein